MHLPTSIDNTTFRDNVAYESIAVSATTPVSGTDWKPSPIFEDSGCGGAIYLDSIMGGWVANATSRSCSHCCRLPPWQQHACLTHVRVSVCRLQACAHRRTVRLHLPTPPRARARRPPDPQ